MTKIIFLAILPIMKTSKKTPVREDVYSYYRSVLPVLIVACVLALACLIFNLVEVLISGNWQFLISSVVIAIPLFINLAISIHAIKRYRREHQDLH